MALVASSLASKLNLWVKIDDSFTADSKTIIPKRKVFGVP
jgi:hypothetical protein